jgi:sarcosine oxidase subunit gamma
MPDPVSPLAGAAVETGLTIQLQEVGPQGMITLRGEAADPAFRAAIETEAPLPGVRRATTNGDRTLLWMSPDEWLLLTPYAEAEATAARLSTALQGVHHMAANVSDARAVFRLTGDAAREVIAKGAPVDLSRAAFRSGDVRRTRLGQLAVAFWLTEEDPDVFHLICFRSVAAYVFDWLQTSARQGGEVGHL